MKNDEHSTDVKRQGRPPGRRSSCLEGVEKRQSERERKRYERQNNHQPGSGPGNDLERKSETLPEYATQQILGENGGPSTSVSSPLFPHTNCCEIYSLL